MTDFLAELGRRAHEFAKCYVALTEALMQEGVPEDVARSEARSAAGIVFAAQADLQAGGEPCPMCGRGVTP